MSADPLSLYNPAIGLFMDSQVVAATQDSRASGQSFAHSATNLKIEERRYGTRYAWRELSLEFAPEAWITANTQGAIPYDPKIGRNPLNTASGNPGIIESAAGKLYRITPGRSSFRVEDISSGLTGRPSVRLAWMTQAANYVIRTDGSSPTQIFNGVTTSSSTGYNRNAPDSSRLPNFASACVFSDRIWIINNNNELIAGDHQHRLEPVANNDLLKTTDQTYDYTSTSFTAPEEMGAVTSMYLVTSYRGGNTPSQGEVVMGTESGGMWSVLTGTPRAQWSSQSMRRVLNADTAPSGPYAGYAATEELIFRSNDGISSIKMTSKETSQVGNPHIEMGQEVISLLRMDSPDLLLYASMAKLVKQQRLLFTVYPRVKGAHRWHTGWLSAALAPGRTRTPEPCIWESVSTLPAAMGEVIQFVQVRSLSQRRTFALLRKSDGTKGLAECTDEWGDDTLADGTKVPVPWQILSRKLSKGGEFSVNSWGPAYLSLRDIRTSVKVRILARDRSDRPFKQVYSGSFTNRTWTALCGTCPSGYADTDGVCIGEILKEFKKPWLEILVQGTGSCVFDLAIGSSSEGRKPSEVSPLDVCLDGATVCAFDPFLRA